MFCSNCGKRIPDNAQLCPYCGKDLGEKRIQRMQLRCKTCDGIMTIEPSSQVLMCPYCGSKELIIENTEVTIERIRSETIKEKYNRDKKIKELDYRKQESQKELELEKLYYDEKKKVRENKRNWKVIGIAFLIMVVMWTYIIISSNHSQKQNEEDGKIYLSSSTKDWVGADYRAVNMELQDLGFTNISLKPLEDLKKDDDKQDGIVYKIMVDGNTDYDVKWFLPDVKINVYYHTLGK